MIWIIDFSNPLYFWQLPYRVSGNSAARPVLSMEKNLSFEPCWVLVSLNAHEGLGRSNEQLFHTHLPVIHGFYRPSSCSFSPISKATRLFIPRIETPVLIILAAVSQPVSHCAISCLKGTDQKCV